MARVNRWPPPLLNSLERQLDELVAAVRDDRNHLSIDERSWLSRFLVVRSCGYLEQVVWETLKGYVDGKSGGMVRTFALSWLERSRNPNPKNLLDLVGRFDASMQHELDQFLSASDQRLYREISFLVDRRNKIAHGLSEGVNDRKAMSLAADARTLADWFILRMNPYR